MHILPDFLTISNKYNALSTNCLLAMHSYAQVQMTQQQSHDGTAASQQQQAQPQAPPGVTGPPQHAVQQQHQQVAVPHQQPGTPTGVTVVSSAVGGAQCVQVPTSSLQIQQQVFHGSTMFIYL
jgi:hypothetical protein